MDLKCRISTPLEAGTSILGAHRLPSYLTPALEYASKRLAGKGLHVTLVVARKDYQLPKKAAAAAAAATATTVDLATTTTTTTTTATESLPTPPRSPEFPNATTAGGGGGGVPRQNSFKSLARSDTRSSTTTKQSQWRKVCSLPRKASIASVLDGAIGRRWPLGSNNNNNNTPTNNNGTRTPATPTTPATPASFVSATSLATASSAPGEPLEPQGPCLRMLHTTALGPRAHNLVTATLARATRRFRLASALAAVEPSSCHIPPIVLHGSILQNEVLFSSEGLTLLSMDHLYTFKSALAHYTTGRTEPGSEFRLEDAVDDLRRYVLSSAGGRRRLLKSVLAQAYDWLDPVNEYALGDVTEMYCRAYGGATGDCGVEDDMVRPRPTPASVEPAAKPTALTPCPGASLRLSPRPEEAGVPTAPEAPMLKYDEVGPVADGLETIRTGTNTPTGQPLRIGSSSNTEEEQDAPTPTQPPRRLVVQTQPQGLQLKTPSPRVAPKASLPALRVRTSFTTQPLVVKPKPRRRKETPAPLLAGAAAAATAQQHHQQQQPLLRPKKESSSSSKPTTAHLDTDAVPLSAVAANKPAAGQDLFPDAAAGDISIEIHADDDDDNDDNDDDDDDDDDDPSSRDDDEADLTEFEDADDLTARPPPSATCGGRTPVEPLWSGIDEILGSSSSRRPATKRGGMMLLTTSHQRRRRRRSSSLVLPPQQQQQQDKAAGPATPNGYDDISPITRGEWGFLMVSDPFRTKTAAVSCV